MPDRHSSCHYFLKMAAQLWKSKRFERVRGYFCLTGFIGKRTRGTQLASCVRRAGYTCVFKEEWRILFFFSFRNRATLQNAIQSSEAFSCTAYPCSRSFQAHTQCRNRQLLLQRQWTCKTAMYTYTLIRTSLSTEKRFFFIWGRSATNKANQTAFLQTNQAITFGAWVHPRSAGRAGRSACGGSNDVLWSIFWRIRREDKRDVVSQHYWSAFSTNTNIFCCELPEIHDRIISLSHLYGQASLRRLPWEGGMSNTISNCFTDQDNYTLAIRQWLCQGILGNDTTSIIDTIIWWYHNKNYTSTIRCNNVITKFPHLNFVYFGNQ